MQTVCFITKKAKPPIGGCAKVASYIVVPQLHYSNLVKRSQTRHIARQACSVSAINLALTNYTRFAKANSTCCVYLIIKVTDYGAGQKA